MTIVSKLLHAELGRNEHQEDEPYFTKMSNQSNHSTVASDYQCQYDFYFRVNPYDFDIRLATVNVD